MDLKVYVYKRPNMFIVNENLYNMIGVGELKKLFTIENYKSEQSTLQLYFPERFLNILEQRALIERARSAGFFEVCITTHSAYIIQTTYNGCCFVIDDESRDEGEFKLSNDNVGMPDDGVLGVLN